MQVIFYALISFFFRQRKSHHLPSPYFDRTSTNCSLREKRLAIGCLLPKAPLGKAMLSLGVSDNTQGKRDKGPKDDRIGILTGTILFTVSYLSLLSQHRIPNVPQRKQIFIIMSRRSWTRGPGFWPMKTKTLCVVLNRSFLAPHCLALWSCKWDHMVCAGGSLQAPPEQSPGPACGEPLTIWGSR